MIYLTFLFLYKHIFIIINLISLLFLVNIFGFILEYISFLLASNWITINNRLIATFNINLKFEKFILNIFKKFSRLFTNKVKVYIDHGIPYFEYNQSKLINLLLQFGYITLTLILNILDLVL